MKNIAIIAWWISGEREVSLRSANNFMANLDTTKYSSKIYDFPNDKKLFLDTYRDYDLVIPFIHGIGWEDWEITAFLEFVWTPYLFSSADTHKLAINKHLAWLFIENMNILYPKSYFVTSIWDLDNITWDKKYFIKPCNGWSSIDNWVYSTKLEAIELVEKILKYDSVLIQEYIQRDREFTLSVVWDYNKDPKVLAITEIVTSKEIFDYDAKYNQDGAIEIIHADIDSELRARFTDISIEIYKAFKCLSFARIDYLYKDWLIYFLEVNTIPGFTKASFLPQAILSRYDSIWEFLDEIL